MKNLNKQQFLRALAKYPGVTWDKESQEAMNIQIDTPKGKVFNNNGCHTIVEPFANSAGEGWKGEAYAEAIRRLSDGLSVCETEDCDLCTS